MPNARERLADARLYLCTDARRDRGDLVDLVRAAIIGGVDVVQLRDKTLTTLEELRLGEQVREVCHREGALFAVNDRADVAQVLGADVFHAGQSDLPPSVSRSLLGPDVVIGRSSRGGEPARAADADPCVDYFCAGPVWETPTKAGRAAIGTDALADVVRSAPTTPWFAIGGIDHERIGAVVEAGASRVVVVRAITDAEDPEVAARSLRRRLPG